PGIAAGLPSGPIPSVNWACATRIAGYGPPARRSRRGVVAEALADGAGVSGGPPWPPHAARTKKTTRKRARRIGASSRVLARLSTKRSVAARSRTGQRWAVTEHAIAWPDSKRGPRRGLSGSAPEPRKDRFPEHCVHRQTFRLRACLDLFPDGLREADRTWACAADLKKFLGATSPDLDRYPLSGDPRRVRIPADR